MDRYRGCLLINYNQDIWDKLTPCTSDVTSLQGHSVAYIRRSCSKGLRVISRDN